MATTQLQSQEAMYEMYQWNIQPDSFVTTYGHVDKEDREGLLSPSFKSRDERISWRMILYENADSNSYKNYISIYLECETSSLPEMSVKYELSILDEHGKERKKSGYHIIILNGYKQPRFGFPNFSERNVVDRRAIRQNGSNMRQSLRPIYTVVCKWKIINSGTIETTKASSLWVERYKNFKLSLESGKFSDVTLVAGEREFPVHKVILAIHSPVFSAMFESEMQEQKLNRVNITDVDDDVLEELLKFIYYTDNLEQIDNMARPLLMAADKYDIKQLKDVCEKSLKKSLVVENSVEYLILADQCDAMYLKRKALDFIVANAGEIVLKNIDVWLEGQLLREVFQKLALTCM